MAEMVKGGPIDVMTGDYLAEVTMMILAKQRARSPELGFASTFLAHLEPVFATVLERGIKVVVNAGGLNPAQLAAATRALASKLGLSAKVAAVEGDQITDRLEALRDGNAGFPNLESGTVLPPSAGFVNTANAYLGAWGIVTALQGGADIVICPRVTDASLVIGAAAWWHGWKRDDYDALAGALAAGHVIECGPQATGGNYSSFTELKWDGLPGFPLAEIASDGSSIITKHDSQPGEVTVGTVTAQLVYEINEPRYLNPDVVARLDTLTLEQVAPNRVELKGTRGLAPPATTKVAITTRGSFINEMTFAFVGLHIDEKIALFEKNISRALKGNLDLRFQRIGTPTDDAPTQDGATVLLRVIARSDDEKLVARAFSAAVIEQGLSSYPGLFATEVPGPGSEAGGYWPTLVKQSDLAHRVVLEDGTSIDIALPPRMEELNPISTPASSANWSGETVRGPLGWLVDARSGDKGSDANVGLWVRTDAAFAWLEATLTVEKLKALLPEAKDLTVERYVMPNLRGLNFMVRGLLEGGAVATLRFDRQAKALGEFLRSRHVDLPAALVEGTKS